MIGLVLAASGHFPYGVKYNDAIVVANFNAAILMRNEAFRRLLANTLFAKVCTSLGVIILILILICCSGFAHPFCRYVSPLDILTSAYILLQQLGGIHGGCASSGVIWLLFKVANNFRNLDVTHNSILIMGVVTNIAVIIALSAFPCARNTHHK